MYIINIITLIIGIIGAAVVIIGLIHALGMLFKFWFGRNHDDERYYLDKIRLDLGRYIVVALEFFIAKDVIETIVVPSMEEMIMLAVLVIIRTILSYFLTREIHQIEQQKIEHRKISAGLK